MSDINWESAPEGATHYDTREGVYPWLKEDDNGNKYWHFNCWVNYSNDIGVNDSIFAKPSKSIYTAAMCEAGELPSVGMECLFFKDAKLAKADWVKGTFSERAYSPVGNAIFLFIDNNTATTHFVESTAHFKPLTPPIELIDGRYYGFNYKDDIWCGIYNADDEKFYFTSSFIVANHCTNIVLLTPEKS